MTKVKYLTPREMLGRFLASEHFGQYNPDYFNEEQKEFWNKKADKLIAFCKKKGFWR